MTYYEARSLSLWVPSQCRTWVEQVVVSGGSQNVTVPPLLCHVACRNRDLQDFEGHAAYPLSTKRTDLQASRTVVPAGKFGSISCAFMAVSEDGNKCPKSTHRAH